MALELVPIDRDEANDFVRRVHRHHDEVVGDRFRVAVAVDGEVVGVGFGGRPSSKSLDDGWTIEITRTATDGYRNACSKIDGALSRAAFALGYRKVITYTLKESESGASLRAAGFRVVAEIRGREWDTKARPRVRKGGAQMEIKLRWEKVA